MFPLPGSSSAPSGQTPPLVLLLLPLADKQRRVMCVCLGSGNVEATFFLQVCNNSNGGD